MDKSKKSTYNRTHYLKNREKIIARSKARWRNRLKPGSNMVLLHGSGDEPKGTTAGEGGSSTGKRKFTFEVMFLLVLVIGMTFYLISELAAFYSTTEGSAGAYLKACIGEGIVFAFSFLNARTAWLRFAHRVLLLLACFYSLWAISGRTVSTSANSHEMAVTAKKAVQELEEEVARRRVLRDRYLSMDRVTQARAYEGSIDSIQHQLVEARKSFQQSGNAFSVLNVLATLVLFRMIVMLANILCVHLLGEVFRPVSEMDQE